MKRDRDLIEFGDMIGYHKDHQDIQERACDGDGTKLPVAPCAQPNAPLSLLALYVPLSPIASQMLEDWRPIRPKD